MWLDPADDGGPGMMSEISHRSARRWRAGPRLILAAYSHRAVARIDLVGSDNVTIATPLWGERARPLGVGKLLCTPSERFQWEEL